MKSYKKMEKELVDYIKNNSSESIDLERYLRFENYGLILDLDALPKEVFTWNPKMLVNTIFVMLAVKTKFEADRPRIKEEGTLYKWFQENYENLISQNRMNDFSEEEFNQFYRCFCSYSLAPLKEEDIKNNVHTFSKFLVDNFKIDEIYSILAELLLDPEDFLNRRIYDLFDGDLIQTFQKQIIKVMRGSNLSSALFQTMSSVYLKKQKEHLIENHILYYLFTSKLDCFNDSDYEGAVLLDASPFFIRKWMMDSKVQKAHALFVFTNENLAKFWNKQLSSRMNIDSVFYSDIDELLTKYSDLNNHIFVFGNHILDEGIKEFLINRLLSEFPFVSYSVYDYDQNIFDELNIKQILKANDLSEIHLLPSGLNNVKRRQRSCLLEFSSGNQQRKFGVTHYTLLKDGAYQKLSPRIYSKYLTQEYFFGSKESIRKIFNESFGETTRKTKQTRNTAKLFKFTEEIYLYYTASYDKKNKSYRVGAYAAEPHLLKDGSIDTSIKVKIKETLKNSRQQSIEEIENWLNFEYPYSFKKGDNPIDIRKEICSVYQPVYKNKPITLKTFVYFKTNFSSRYGENQMEILSVLCETMLGKTLMDNISPTITNNILDDLYDSIDDENKRHQAKALLSDVIDHAIKDKNATKNLIKEEVIEESNIKDKAFYQSREHLTIKYFSQSENLKLYKHITKNIEKDSRYLGAYIKLVTGLESNIVCALQWKDFVLLQDYNVNKNKYQLIVRKQLLNDGSRFVGFSRKELYRKIPCNDVLTEILLNQREQVMLRTGVSSLEEINDFSIVGGSKSIGDIKVVSPMNLSTFCGKLVKKLRKGYSLISEIPDSKKGTIETDFLSYGGDIYKSNYQHYGLYKASFNQGELDYLLGRKTDTPFARNYCDFGNDAAQLVLGVKQNRFMTIFIKEEKQQTKFSRLIPDSEKNIKYISETSKSNVVNVIGTLSLTEEADFDITIENNYGFDLTISKIERRK